jgi:hypothetical protein
MLLAVSMFLAGCGSDRGADKQKASDSPGAKAAGHDDEAKIAAALEKLSPEDRKLAEEQKYCAVMTDHRLGSMGPPVKVTLNDQFVFVCCKTCQKKAEKDPEKVLARAKELKDKAAAQPKE